jgi:hypothetical protein
LHLEAVAEKPAAQPGENLTLQVEVINRSPVSMKLQSLHVLTNGEVTPVGKVLVPNETFIHKTTIALPKDLPFSHPYWLRQPGTVGTYAITCSGGTDDDYSFDYAPGTLEVTYSISGGGGCGIGPELALLVPALAWLRRRRRRIA